MVSNPFLASRASSPARNLVECRACPRLVAWREGQAACVPPRYRAWVDTHGFWARPVPAFGDRSAWLAIVGLAPAAQGANRTGRMFTGDRSGEFLFAALHRAGLANMPRSEHRTDVLKPDGVLITAALRCAPPANRPTTEELARCSGYLRDDLSSCSALRVVLALGRIAHENVVRLLRDQGDPLGGEPAFGHGATHLLPGGAWLVDSYHVSQQNTFTGRLTVDMFDGILRLCRRLAGLEEGRT
jgi:uracil-DNA glycosylase family 4